MLTKLPLKTIKKWQKTSKTFLRRRILRPVNSDPQRRWFSNSVNEIDNPVILVSPPKFWIGLWFIRLDLKWDPGCLFVIVKYNLI